jgi:TolB-like protein/opacity protein-like surface antigen
MKTLSQLFIFALIIITAQAAFAQQKGKAPAIPGVAVMNFTNNTGNSSLDHLSSSIPESVSAAMSQSSNIRIVERANMGKLVGEMELQQSGLTEAGAAKVGKLAKADVIIIGSYAGDENNLVVSIKAIEVSSGRLIDGRVLQGSTKRIFDIANLTALSMAAVISGKNLGYITISTNPDDSDVFIDGVMVGKSPIIDYKVPAGDHRLSAVKNGFLDTTTSISVGENAHERWSPSLAEKKLLNRSERGLGVYAFIPMNSGVKMGGSLSYYFGKNYESIFLGFAFNGGLIPHDQKLNNGTEKELRFMLTSVSLLLNFTPFTEMRYFSPYFGIMGEFGGIFSLQKPSSGWETEDSNHRHLLYGLGATAGVNFLPYSKISLFAEGRFIYYPSVNYNDYTAGTPQKKKMNLMGVSIGGGVKFYIN